MAKYRLSNTAKEDLIRGDWILKNMGSNLDNYKLENAIEAYVKYQELKQNC